MVYIMVYIQYKLYVNSIKYSRAENSLEFDHDLSGFPRHVAHVPVAVEVGHQPAGEDTQRVQINTP